MKNTFGSSISITLFGESHGQNIGAVIDGLPAGISVDTEKIESYLAKRRPFGKISTPRREKDSFRIASGVFNGKTCGTPICILIENSDTNSSDYEKNRFLPRPSHADFTADCKYHGFQDYRGGGHFSGRITAPVVACGGIIIPALRKKGIVIATHIKECAEISDRNFEDFEKDAETLNNMDFAVLDNEKKEKMILEITSAAKDGDSVGGILETVICGMPKGIGEPYFDSFEGVLSHALFSIPALHGVEFGAGFGFAGMKGSDANDPFVLKDGKIVTKTNNSGGINGGISNGMPIIFRTVYRPTPSISKEQQTVNLSSMKQENISLKGRHDPCILHRARVVQDSVAALCCADLLSVKYGGDWLGE